MTTDEFLRALLASESIAATEAALAAFEQTAGYGVSWRPFGRENNRGTVEASTDPGRSLVERVTNGIDAVLESEHRRHDGRPACRNPKEAASAWLNVPTGGLSDLSPAQRRQIAQNVTVRVGPGESKQSRLVEIRDKGIGLAPEQMPFTILSLNESNKSRKPYLAGAYGQGGSSTLAVSKYTFFASLDQAGHDIGFTVARFYEPPADEDKLGRYVFLATDAGVLRASPIDGFDVGTLVRHFGYDLSEYTSPFGPTSLYGLLNRILFDPVLPVWLDNPVNNQRRVIKGSRNALNGALDEGDEDRRGGPLSHSVPLYFTSIGEDFGRIGLEYWVLPKPTAQNKRPNAAFVNPSKPIVLTVNGQNHAEFSALLIRKQADLPFLTQRMVVHLDCNALTPYAKRLLFVSNREDARRGAVRELLSDEIIRALRSDDELKRLNAEARREGMHERDENARQQVRREVSRLLRLQGLQAPEPVGDEPQGDQPGPVRPPRPRPPSPPPVPIEVHEPPTYIKLVWEEGQPVSFHPEQRRYVRVETDASSTYHDPRNPAQSRINIIASGPLRSLGSTPLRSGRLRLILEAPPDAAVGHTGSIRVELTRVGLPVLVDEREVRVVPKPPSRPGGRPQSLPDWDVRRVEGPQDPSWTNLGWPDDINAIASTAQMEDGQLVIYYSAVFPRYRDQEQQFERREPSLAISFRTRYEIWLAVHSLLMHHKERTHSSAEELTEDDADAAERRDHEERIRIAVLAAMFAAREAQQPNLAAVGAGDLE